MTRLRIVDPVTATTGLLLPRMHPRESHPPHREDHAMTDTASTANGDETVTRVVMILSEGEGEGNL